MPITNLAFILINMSLIKSYLQLKIHLNMYWYLPNKLMKPHLSGELILLIDFFLIHQSIIFNNSDDIMCLQWTMQNYVTYSNDVLNT